MNFSIEEKENVKILRLDEERLDSKISADLKAQLLVLAEDETCKVLVDLSNVKYADSSGLGALLLGLRHSRDIGSQFALFGAQKRVETLIGIAQLDHIMISFKNEESALKEMI